MSSPTSIYEPARVLSWLDSVLKSLAPGGAWEGVAPDNTTAPYIVYNLQASSEVDGVAGHRLWNSSLYLVKVTGPSDGSGFAALVAIADAVDSALQLTGALTIGVAADGFLLRCVRETVLPLPAEIVGGVHWASLGALWRIQAQKAP